MSSMAQQAIEMGIDPCIAPGGGTWDDPTNREYNNYYDYEEPTWFATSKEALDYAKKNIGITITRASDGNGYVIKK